MIRGATGRRRISSGGTKAKRASQNRWLSATGAFIGIMGSESEVVSVHPSINARPYKSWNGWVEWLVGRGCALSVCALTPAVSSPYWSCFACVPPVGLKAQPFTSMIVAAAAAHVWDATPTRILRGGACPAFFRCRAGACVLL